MPSYESELTKLCAETRSRLRSTQILTTLATIVSELLQNAIDAEASQIDIGVDCAEWSCWVMDNGTGFTKEGLHRIGQGRYNTSKADTSATLAEVTTFGFRGEALASMADLSCMEVSSRTARSRESWSVIAKGARSLYMGPSIRWRRESPGTVVSIRDAFFSLPVRRQSHPSPSKTIELVRQQVEAHALMFPDISLSLQDTSKTKESHKSHIFKIPKARSTLAAFRHIYGRAFTEEKIATTSGQLQIEGFISLVGAHTKSYQFLYINRHPISTCDLHRLIDTRFGASTFAKHAYDEAGETSLRPSARRSPRKGEKKPVYVLNLFIPAKYIDNCLEPSKSTVHLDNKNVVTSFLSETIQSFLVRHNFASDKRGNEIADSGGPKKKRKFSPQSLAILNMPSGIASPNVAVHMGKTPDTEKTVWKDPSTGESLIVDIPTGTSCTQSSRSDTPIQGCPSRRTLQTARGVAGKNEHVPEWLREALRANDAFALQEPKIPSLSQSANHDTDYRNSGLHDCHMGVLTKRASWCLFQPGASSFVPSQIRFRKEDLRDVQIISQVDCKFIACVVGLDRDHSSDDETCQDGCPADGKTLILIDQHAADERVRVERLLKSVCRGFLGHQDGSGGVEMKQLSPPIPVLLTRREASRLAELADFHKAFESWGFRFSGLEETRSRLDHEAQSDDGYLQVFVSAIPEIVSEKLLLGKEIQELIKGYIGALESEGFEPTSSRHDVQSTDEDIQWLKALRRCPRGLLDLINSKACRGAIMFNDPLNTEQCERLVKQLSTTVFPFQCAHGRPSLVPLMRLSDGPKETRLEWEKVAAL